MWWDLALMAVFAAALAGLFGGFCRYNRAAERRNTNAYLSAEAADKKSRQLR